MGMTSTGKGKAPSDLTSLVSSMMQTNFVGGRGDDLLAGERSAAALDQHAVLVGLVGAVDVEGEIAFRVEIEYRDPRRLQRERGPLGTRDRALKLDFTVFQLFDEFAHRRARSDAEDHALFDVGNRGFARRGVFFRFAEMIFPPLKTTVPAYAGTVDYFRRLTFS